MTPIYNLSHFALQNLLNLEFCITVYCPQPIDAAPSNKLATGYAPMCMLTLSSHAAKNLSVLLAEQVRQYEAQYGEIITPMMLEKKPVLSS